MFLWPGNGSRGPVGFSSHRGGVRRRGGCEQRPNLSRGGKGDASMGWGWGGGGGDGVEKQGACSPRS